MKIALLIAGMLLSVCTYASPPPSALSQTRQLKEDNSVSITLKAITSTKKKLSYSIIQPPKHGVVTLHGNEAVYSPHTNFNGIDSFQYCAIDGQSSSAPAVVNLQIQPINDPPVARPQNIIVVMGSASSITLLASDPDNDPISYVISSPPKYGQIAITGNVAKYTPKRTNNKGLDKFSFIAKDQQSQSKVTKILVYRSDKCPQPQAFERGVCVLSTVSACLNPTTTSNDACVKSTL